MTDERLDEPMTRTDELTGRLLDGTLADVEWVELESLLVADSGALADHVALLELEGVLRGLRTDFDLTEPTLAKVKEIQADRTTRAVMSGIAGQPAPAWADQSGGDASPTWRRRWLFATAGAFAVAAAIVLGLWLGGGSPDSPVPGDSKHPDPIVAAGPGTARLTGSSGSVELLTPQGETLSVVAGCDVPAGHTLQTVGEDSLARVEMPDRTTVDVEPNSVVRFVSVTGNATSKPRLFLARGQLTAAVPEGVTDRQIVVGTGVAEVFARKGTFVVSSAGPESARIDVRKGNVDVVRMDARTRIPLTVGAAIVQAGFEKVVIETAIRVDRTPSRSLSFPGPRDAVFSPDGHEVWVASPRQFTRWTRDGGTADVPLLPHKGASNGPLAVFTRDKTTLITSVINNPKEEKTLLRLPPEGAEGREINVRFAEARLWTAAPAAAWFATTDPKPHHRRLRVFDGTTGEQRFTHEFAEVVTCLVAAPDGRTLAAGLSDARGITRVLLLDPKSGEQRAVLPTQKKGLVVATFSADGQRLAIGFNGLVQIWDVRSRELMKSISGFERMVTCLTFSPNGKAIAGGTQDGQVWVWSVATGKPIQLIEVGSRGVRSVGFSPDGKRLVTVANTAPVGLWDVAEIPSELGTDVQ